MLDALLDIAIDLSKNISEQDRYQRLLGSVRSVVPCDASALLKYEKGIFVPVAVDGLEKETLGRRFDPKQHPRLQRIMTSREPVHFPSDSTLPDPYDGLVINLEGELAVHSCMGCSLYMEDQLLGILTIDGLQPGLFDELDQQTIVTFSALAAAAMKTALLLEQLENKAVQQNLLAQELVDEAYQKGGGELIGQSPAMSVLKREIEVVAQSELSVLITGETGVGKELVARTVHLQSQRAREPLVYINCAALPESIAESELFGHIKGAFTGASTNRGGKFELANGGTLFLDEIGELPLSIQSKLLRVLQNGEIQRVGSDKLLTVDVRILAATNRNLKEEVVEGNFRQDLYHRLSVFPILAPPLRERDGDISILTGFFLERIRIELGLRSLRLSIEATGLLNQYNWPGNVRELEHVISRAALRARAQSSDVINAHVQDSNKKKMVTIEASHCDICDDIASNETTHHVTAVEQEAVEHVSEEPVSLSTEVEEFQRKKIQQVLNHNSGNWSKTAISLGMDRGNLHRLAKRLNIK